MRNFKYILMVLLGGAMYGTMSSLVKLSYSRGYNAAEISFAQAFLAALFLGGVTIVNPNKTSQKKLSRKDLVSLLATGSTIGLTNLLYYQSVSYISASMAIVILMNFTWFSIVLEWVIFGKRPYLSELLAVPFVLIGSLLASGSFQHGTSSLSWQGITLALASSLTYAIYIVASSRIGKNVHWMPKSTLIMTGSASMIFLINAQTITFDNHFDTEFLALATFLAIAGTSVPTALFASGIPKIGAGVSSILMTVELPVAVLCAHIILDESVGYIQGTGIAVMLMAIFFLNHGKPGKFD